MIKRKLGLLASLPLAIAAVNSQAIQYDWKGPGSLAWDNSISQGTLWRLNEQDETNDGINGNDGNRNYDKGIVAQTLKLTTEMDLNFDNFGAFVRATAHKDFDMSGSTDWGKQDFHSTNDQPGQANQGDYTDAAKDYVGERAEFLDAYLYGFTDIGDMTLSAKLGRHVTYWGETQFYRNGIGDTLAVDAGKLKLPGVGLKEALIPANSLSMNLSVSENLDMEGFYMLEYRETRLTPVGSYYSTGDLFAPGGNTAYNSTGPLAGGLNAYALLNMQGVVSDHYATADYMQVASIKEAELAKDDGQFGLAVRYRFEELNDTEFGAYFVNYHSKTPVVSANISDNINDNVMAEAQAAMVAAPQIPNSQVATLMNAVVPLEVAANVEANRKYLEDLNVMGVSFNTMAGETAIAGEVAYRPDMPINVAHDDDLIKDLISQAGILMSGGDITLSGQTMNLAELKQGLDSYTERDVVNFSVNATHNFGRSVFSDQVIMMAEVAGEQIQGDLTYTDYNGVKRSLLSKASCSVTSDCAESGKLTKNSWGYSLFMRSTWNNVFTGTTLASTVRYKHDVEGNSHKTGNFAEDVQALTASVDASVFGNFKTAISYTNFYGGVNNKLRDRDTVSLTMNYSF